MTDVNIELPGGPVTVPAWSTEATLQSLLNRIPENSMRKMQTDVREMARKLGAAISGDDTATDDAISVLNTIKKTIGDLVDTLPTDSETAKHANTITDAAKGAVVTVKDTLAVTMNATSSFTHTLTDLTKNIFDLNNNIVDLETPLRRMLAPLKQFPILGLVVSALGAAAGGAAMVLGRYISLMVDGINVQRTINELGIRGIRSTTELYNNFAELGMTTAQFEAILKNYSTAMGTFGTSSILDMVKSVEGAEFQLNKLGLTAAEGAEYAAQTLEQQRLAGLFGRIDTIRNKEAFQESMKAVSSFSGMMNVSRQKIMESVTDMLRQDKIRTALMGIESSEREKVSESLKLVTGAFAGLGPDGAKLQSVFEDIFTAATPAQVQGWVDMMSLGGPAGRSVGIELQNLAQAARSGSVTQTSVTQSLIKMAQGFEDGGSEFIARQRLIFASTEYAAILDSLGAFGATLTEMEERYKKEKQNNETYSDFLNRKRDEEKKELEVATKLNERFNIMKTQFNQALLDFINLFIGQDGATDAMGSLTKFSNDLGVAFGSVIEWTERLFDEAGADTIQEKLRALFVGVGKILMKEIGLYILAFLAAPTLINLILKGAGGLFGILYKKFKGILPDIGRRPGPAPGGGPPVRRRSPPLSPLATRVATIAPRLLPLLPLLLPVTLGTVAAGGILAAGYGIHRMLSKPRDQELTSLQSDAAADATSALQQNEKEQDSMADVVALAQSTNRSLAEIVDIQRRQTPVLQAIRDSLA